MTRFLQIPTALALCAWASLLCSCSKEFKPDNFTAYFGGEVANPLSRYVLLYKGNTLIDSIKLDKDNRFFKKFDSLAPGMYTFKHDPEYQYVYFEKNDSIMVSINTQNFDESIVFSGRGEQKNNFLMEMYLGNENDRQALFQAFDYDINRFNNVISGMYKKNLERYNAKKEFIKWSDEFDVFARASIDYPYYSRKEVFPVVHKLRTGKDMMHSMPANYYDYRKQIDYNNPKLCNYSPFVKYLSHMLNNVAVTTAHQHGQETTDALKANTIKLEIADTLIKNEKVKNIILNNIAYSYFMEDQNLANHEKFLETYNRFSTDKSQKNDIVRLTNSIRGLMSGKSLPVVTLIDTQAIPITSDKLLNRQAIIIFWSEKAMAHIESAATKLQQISKKYPSYQIVCVNLDDDQDRWTQELRQINLPDNVIHMRCDDFEDIKNKWAITKIHRTIVLNPNTSIRNAFTNLFNADFEKNLQ